MTSTSFPGSRRNGGGVFADSGPKKVGVSQLPTGVVIDAAGSPKGINSTGVADGDPLVYNSGSSKYQPVSGQAFASTTSLAGGYTDGGYYPSDVNGNLALGSTLPHVLPGTGFSVTAQFTDATHFTVTVGSLAAAAVGWQITGASVGAAATLGTITDSTHGILAGDTYVGALNSNVTLTLAGAHGNVVIGTEWAGTQISSGWHNIAIGAGTLGALNNTTPGGSGALTTAFSCIAIGDGALAFVTTGSSNVGIGSSALGLTTSGRNNVAVGGVTLAANTTGSNNVAVGQAVLTANTTGSNNTALGNGVLTVATTASGNTAVGAGSMNATTTGSNNTAGGFNSLVANTTGANNTAFGLETLQANITGSNNTAVGELALGANTASSNVGLGMSAGFKIVAGSANTFVGKDAGNNGGSTDASNAVGIGSGCVVGASSATAIGTGASATGVGSVAIGRDNGNTGASATGVNDFVLGTALHKLFIPGLPTADPSVAGQLYTAGVPSPGVPKAVMVSGG